MAAKIISKQCSKCKEIKPISEFPKNSHCKDGRLSYCKSCKYSYQNAYYKSEHGKAVRRRYQQSEKFKTYQKNWRKSEKGRKLQAGYVKRYMEKYKLKHPERRKAKDAIKEAIKRGKLPPSDTLQCYYCPAQAQQYHHWHGYAPKHWLDVIPVCRKCHRLNE